MSNVSRSSIRFSNFFFKVAHLLVIIGMVLQCFAIASPVQAKSIINQPEIDSSSNRTPSERPENIYIPQIFHHKQPRIVEEPQRNAIQVDSINNRHILQYQEIDPLYFAANDVWNSIIVPILPEHRDSVVGIVVNQKNGGSGSIFLGNQNIGTFSIPEGNGIAIFPPVSYWPDELSEGFTASELENAGINLDSDFSVIEDNLSNLEIQFPIQSSWMSLRVNYRSQYIPCWPACITEVFGYIYVDAKTPPLPLESIVSGVCDCCFSSYCDVSEEEADPVNVYTGGFTLESPSLSFLILGGQLSFLPSYTSLTANKNGPLGYGWTHNFDQKLIFPNDPDGEPGIVKFKGNSSNLYRFISKQDGIYIPYEGLLAKLTKNSGTPVTYTLTDLKQTTYHFNESGKITHSIDSIGNLTSYFYDLNNRLARVEGPGEIRKLIFSYDQNDKLISVSDHTGRNLIFSFDSNGDLTSVTDVLGNEWDYFYNTSHQMIQATNPKGKNLFVNQYDSQGRVTHQYDAAGNIRAELVYGENVTEVFDNSGASKTYFFNPLSGAISEIEDELGNSEFRTQEDNFRPATMRQEGGGTTQFTWSENGANLLSSLDAEGNQIDLTYDVNNNLTSTVDAKDYLTTFTYEGNQLSSMINALNETTNYTYTASGLLETETDPLGNFTSYTYEENGQLLSQTDGLSHTTSYTYDDLGRRLTTVDPAGRVTKNEYDAEGRVTQSTRNYDDTRAQNDVNQYNIVTSYVYDNLGNLLSSTDTLGHTTSYEYDDANRLITTTDPSGASSHNSYNDLGQLASTTDALDHVTTFTYDDAGRMIHTTGPIGSGSSIVFDAVGTIGYTTNALDQTIYYEYDDIGREISTTQSDGSIISREYDENGNVISSTDALGKLTTYEYDALNRVIKQIDPLGGEIESFYDDAGNLVQTIDPRGQATTYAYDELNRQISVTDALGHVTSYEYDDLGRRSAMIDAEGHRTVYAYDALDRVISETDSEGHVTSSSYDALGRVLSRTNADNQTTSYEYDALGRTISQTDPMGNVTTYSYDALGNLETTTNPLGNSTQTVYDDLNRPITVTDSLGNTVTTAYNALGLVVSTTDADGNTTTFAYDAMGRQTGSTDPLGHSSENVYDACGRLVEKIDANGVHTRYEYDDLNRLTAVVENYEDGGGVDADTNVRTEYTFDANGNRLTILDGNGHTTTFTYDELNRLTGESDALGHPWTYAYDNIGNRVSMTDANGVTTGYAYNADNRLTGIDSTGTEADVTYTYDGAGLRQNMADDNGTTSWVYDLLGRPTAISDAFYQEVRYEYDAERMLRRTYPGKDIHYTYDAADRLIHVNDNDKNTYYEYDPSGHLQKIIRPNGVNSEYTYDATGNLITQSHATEERALGSYNYTYDNVGNRTRVVENLQTGGAGPTVRLTVIDDVGWLQIGKEVTVFDGQTDTGFHATTDANGQVSITLPQGSYRFRVDTDGVQFWSGTENHCTIGVCSNLIVTIPNVVSLNIHNNGAPLPGVQVVAYQNGVASTYQGLTGEDGFLLMRMPLGEYSFRILYNEEEFWTDELCVVPGCQYREIDVNRRWVTVSVLDNLGMPQANVPVTAYDGETSTDFSEITDVNGQVKLSLPQGNYRFRADFYEAAYWSDIGNHCSVPGCQQATINVRLPLVVTVIDENNQPQAGLPVSAYDGATFTGLGAWTDENGRAFIANLPAGSYHFATTYNEVDYWSGEENHCTIPECTGAQIAITSGIALTPSELGQTDTPTPEVPTPAEPGQADTPTPEPTPSETPSPEPSSTESGYLPNEGTPAVYLSDANELIRTGARFFSMAQSSGQNNSGGEYAVIWSPKPQAAPPNDVTVTVIDSDNLPMAGITVRAYRGSTYASVNGVTDGNGQVVLTLPDQNYRFRANVNGKFFWSGTTNHCTVPGCDAATISVNKVTVTILDSANNPVEGYYTEAHKDAAYADLNGETDANGQIVFYLPDGNYRYATIPENLEFWSGEAGHCVVPGCTSAQITLPPPVIVTLTDSNNNPMASQGIEVYRGEETTSINSGGTDSNGQVSFLLPEGSYRFSSTPEDTEFFSGEVGHCVVPGCTSAQIAVTAPLVVMVVDANNVPQKAVLVTVYQNGQATGASNGTDSSGQAFFSLPNGSYRFKTSIEGLDFWSGEGDHCAVPTCQSAQITIPAPVIVTVVDANSIAQGEVLVSVYQNGQFTGVSGGADSNGQAVFTLPPGAYRFAADREGLDFWSGETDHCSVPTCTAAQIQYTPPVTVTLVDGNNTPVVGEGIEVFRGEETTSITAAGTDANGQVQFTLPAGAYRFVTYRDEFEFSSGVNSHCIVPECQSAQIHYNLPVTITLVDGNNTPLVGEGIEVFRGNETEPLDVGGSDANGQAQFILPDGNYRFRTIQDGYEFWSGEAGHCVLPGCTTAQIHLNSPITISVIDGNNNPLTGDGVEIFRGEETESIGAGAIDSNGQVQFILPDGAYRFAVIRDNHHFWSGETGHCVLPGCTSANILVEEAVTLSVVTYDSFPQPNLPVYAFDGETYTGYSAVTNANGQVQLILPNGNYHFSTELNGTIFWSGSENHCAIPECDESWIEVSKPVTVTILDASGTPPPAGALVRAYNNDLETRFTATTDVNGQAVFTLPASDYRFRANLRSSENILGGWQVVDFWSGAANHCTLPGCETAAIAVPKPVTVTVLNAEAVPQGGVNVNAYSGEDKVNFDLTNADGTVKLYMPDGSYRFGADFMGATHWSGEAGHCVKPGCETAAITFPHPVIVTVTYENGDPYPGIDIYAFNGDIPSAYGDKTDAAGQALVYAPAGAYRFAADIKGTLFFSDQQNHCTIPECSAAAIPIPGGYEYKEVTIDYTYDGLYRLTKAEYSTGEVFEYSYDAAGNRLTQTVTLEGTPVTTSYSYDEANRLSQVGSQAYTWDNNGNLLSDGEKTYTYDPANRLTALTIGEETTNYLYNGQGDRIAQVEDGVQTPYILDLNAGLTQVLNDGEHSYVYGLDLVSQQTGINEEYPLRDALGSVRQVTDQSSAITGYKSYQPYGSVLSSSGQEGMSYGYAGEWTDSSGMQYLRARYYAPSVGRFVSRDSWEVRIFNSFSLNRWSYVEDNPINKIDPRGLFSSSPIHAIIQAHFAETYGAGHLVESEFPVSGGSKQGLHFTEDIGGNIIQSGNPTGNTGFIDIVDISTGEAYEIKSEKEFSIGIFELSWYISTYNAKPRLNGLNQLTPGINYRWASQGWEIIGTNPLNPGQVIMTQMRAAGIITYIGIRKDLIPEPIPVYFWEWNSKNKTVEKIATKLIPNLSPSPVPAFSDLPSLCINLFIIVTLIATPIPDDVFIPPLLKGVYSN